MLPDFVTYLTKSCISTPLQPRSLSRLKCDKNLININIVLLSNNKKSSHICGKYGSEDVHIVSKSVKCDFVLNHSYGYLECISWIPGFNGKTQRNKNDFFWRCHVWKITIFPQPRGGQKRHFFAQIFFSEYRLWSQVGASGVVYLSFLRMYGEKMINFPAQWHIMEF